MSLTDLAVADNRAILENVSGGFGRAMTLTDPAGTSAALAGMGHDIGLTIDPQTGDAIAGRRASVTLPLAAISEAGLGQPTGIADASQKPWRVTFQTAGGPRVFKITETMPDHFKQDDAAAGCIVCFLEEYTV